MKSAETSSLESSSPLSEDVQAGVGEGTGDLVPSSKKVETRKLPLFSEVFKAAAEKSTPVITPVSFHFFHTRIRKEQKYIAR